MESAASACARLRWAVSSGAWQPEGGADGDEWRFLLALLPPEAAARVCKFVHFEDRKRALASQLLQRAACERALGVPFREAVLTRTKGGKPFLANPPPQRAHAPNWNFNVSHEGDYVVLAAEPFCVCGVDVAAPGQLRRGGAATPPMREFVQLFKCQFTPGELARVLAAEPEAARQDTFRQLWSLKEAFVKARGDGLAFELGRAEFELHSGGAAGVRVDGALQPHWAFTVQQLGPPSSCGAHWVTVARCRPHDVVDAAGVFRATLQTSFDDAGWQRLLAAPTTPFELLSVADLLPACQREGYAAAGGDVL